MLAGGQNVGQTNFVICVINFVIYVTTGESSSILEEFDDAIPIALDVVFKGEDHQ